MPSNNTIPQSLVHVLLSAVITATAVSAHAGPFLKELQREAGDSSHVTSTNHTQNSQPTLNSTALSQDIPLRNLRVEVRQLGNQAANSRAYQANARIILQPGNSRGNIQFGARNNDRIQHRNLAQNTLVMNGRQTRFHIGNTVPLQFYQTFVRYGRVNFVPSTVFIEANSGFYAQPTWYGGQDVEVEIGTILSTQDPHRHSHRHSTHYGYNQQLANANAVERTTTSSTINIPLGEWTTIAESNDEQYNNDRGTLHKRNTASSQNMQVQMRVSVQ